MAKLRCRLLSRHYLDFIDNELAAGSRQKVAEHLESCAECRRAVAALRAEAATADLIEPVAPPEGFSAKVLQRLQAADVRRPARRVSRPLSLTQVGWAAAAMAVLVLALGYFATHQRPPAVSGTTPPGTTIEGLVAEQPEAAQPAVVEGSAPEMTETPDAPAADMGTEYAAASTDLTTEEVLEAAVYDEQDGYLEDALEGYQAAAEEDPENRDAALFAAGRVYERMGMTISAIEAFEEALAYSQEYEDEWERS